MPVNYPGDQTHTQAPSAAPQPAGTITIALPADGDPPNASTFAQGYKVVADFIDWLLKPKAKLSDWAAPIMRWRSARGHTRSTIDHLGFRGGRVFEWNEDWPGGIEVLLPGGGEAPGPVDIGGAVAYSADFSTAMTSLASELHNAAVAANFAAAQTNLQNCSNYVTTMVAQYTASLTLNGWLTKALKTTGTSRLVFHSPDNGDTVRHRWVSIDAGDTAGDYRMLYRPRQVNVVDDIHIVLEWEMFIKGGSNVPNRNIYVGLCDEGVSPGLTAQDYLVFQLGPSGNWFCDRAGGGTGAAVDSGVAPSAGYHHFRIEFHGANVSEDNTRTARWFIDGVQVASATTNLPFGTAYTGAHISVLNAGGGVTGLTDPFRLGPMKFRSNLYASDVF